MLSRAEAGIVSRALAEAGAEIEGLAGGDNRADSARG